MASGSSSSTSFFRWFFMEYVPGKNIAMLPRLFCMDHLNHVSKNVLFRDPVNNIFHIAVLKTDDDLYFTYGWSLLRDVFHLENGAWMKFYFFDESEFFVRVFDRNMVEFNYPVPSNVYHHGVGVSPDLTVPSASWSRDFHHASIDKVLSEKQVSSNRMTMPVVLCKCLPLNASNIVLRDENRTEFQCRFRRAPRRRNEGYITNGWQEFCSARGLSGGCVVRFSVSSESIRFVQVQYKWIIVEFDNTSDVAALPWMFSRVFYHHIPSEVNLFDRHGNEFVVEDHTGASYMFARDFCEEVEDVVYFKDIDGRRITITVQKDEDRIYFAVGWKDIGNLYNLKDGGWLKVEYQAFSTNSFLFEVLDMPKR
ncbi:DNA-binding barrel domain superfamily [Sesbania bispinosa]|nr:DNA-binding barrel domain superfamily [Sesbania bispinosa]